MKTCQVRDCETEFAEIHSRAGVDSRVCADHGLRLRAGENYHYDPETREIVIGADSMLTLLNFQTHTATGVEHRLVTLSLGRNGIEEQTVTFQVPEELFDKFNSTIHPES